MTEIAEKRRVRFSLRGLMIVIAICALLLVPCVWFLRLIEDVQRQRIRATHAAQLAQVEAMRARLEAEVQRAAALSPSAKANEEARSATTPPATEPNGGLWAALGVNHPVFDQGAVKDLNIEFTLVNDGPETVNPKLTESQIVVNGKALEDSAFILGNGPRDGRFEALPPGNSLRFGYALGKYFETPGVYRVAWRGGNFQSPEIVLRVLKAPGDRQP